jgi:hypothetical protein
MHKCRGYVDAYATRYPIGNSISNYEEEFKRDNGLSTVEADENDLQGSRTIKLVQSQRTTSKFTSCEY